MPDPERTPRPAGRRLGHFCDGAPPLKTRFLCVGAVAVLLAAGTAASAQEVESLYDLSLQELTSLRASSGGALTKTQAGRTPASMTIITRQMIRESGARNLNELLEIYVPNYLYLRQASSGLVLGMRGIISGRSNKTLLLVNGRVMNHRLMLGALSEHFLPLLGDIEAVEVVRGPGSSMYGSGAINGVINIKTQNQDPFTGIDVSVGKGYVEGFTLAEVRMGRALGSKGDVLVYLGADRYPGADAADAPVGYSTTYRDVFTAGVPVGSGPVRDHQAMDDEPQQKAHVQLRYGDTRVWARFVRGSTHFLPARSGIENRGFETSINGLLYEQFTVQAEQRIPFSPSLSLDLRASYDVYDLARRYTTWPKDMEYTLATREDELTFRGLLSWTPSGAHSLAAGVEQSGERFGLPALGLTTDPSHNGNALYDEWETSTLSFLGEYQWNPAPAWTVFLGGRADNHTFTNWMYSPKAAVVFSQSERHTSKLIFNRSVRKSDDIELKIMDDKNPGLDPEVETIGSLELSHDVRMEDSFFSVTAFRYDADLIGWLGHPTNRTAPLGTSTVHGLEAEARHEGRTHQVTVSYAYTKLSSFELANQEVKNQLETSAPYGYGNDLQNWPRHVARIGWRWQLRRDLIAHTTLRVMGRFQGAEDYAAYNNEVHMGRNQSQTDGRTDAFAGNIYMNSGLMYQVASRFDVDLRLHNLLGWIQPDLNKRNFYGRLAGYRLEAPGVSVRLNMRF
jgi:outer membrane receptor for ferrienterochelin and colicin